jgi:hypothetical protein
VIVQRFMSTSDEGYLAFIEIKLSIMATWKIGSIVVLRPSAQGYVAKCERINGIFEAHESLGWRLHVFRWATFQHFGGMKNFPALSLNPPMQANWLHVNHCSKFWLLENVIVQRFIRTPNQGYIAFIEIQLIIMVTWKKVSLSFLKTSAQSYVAKCERINGIFVA